MDIFIEIFGYFGTALVVISMMMTSVTKLRVINICGSIISATYAGIFNTWPIFVMNICLIVINTFHLVRSFLQKEQYSYVKTNYLDPTIERYINYYKKDIKKFYSSFNTQNLNNRDIYLIYSKSDIIGFIIGKTESQTLYIDLCYARKKYRYMIFTKIALTSLQKINIRVIKTNKQKTKFNKYLIKLGFKEQDDILVKYI